MGSTCDCYIVGHNVAHSRTLTTSLVGGSIRPGEGGLKFLLQFLQLFLVQSLYKATDTELIRPGGRGAKNPLRILTISLVQTQILYKAKDTRLIRSAWG